jgi:hypothetical protein
MDFAGANNGGAATPGRPSGSSYSPGSNSTGQQGKSTSPKYSDDEE